MKKWNLISNRLWDIPFAVGWIGVVATGFGFLGRYGWFLDLFAHFRVQYSVLLIFSSLLFLITKHTHNRWWAGLFLLFAGFNFMEILPFYGPKPTSANDPSGPVWSLMLINVNSKSGDPLRVQRLIQVVDADILVLEEITDDWLQDLKGSLESYPHACIETREDNFGIGLFSRFPLINPKILDIGGVGIPSIQTQITIQKRTTTITAIHPPPPVGGRYSQLRNSLFSKLPEYIHEKDAANVVIGDFNCTPWSFHFKELIRRTGLVNSGIGRGVQPTWPAPIPLLWIPIDHCLHSKELAVINRKTGPYLGSDHFPLIIEIALR